MKGNPALRTLLVLFLLGVILIPVRWVVSRHQPAVSSPSPASRKEESHRGTLSVKAAPQPSSLTIISLGKPILSIADATGTGIWSRELVLPAGSDLIVRAEWWDDRPHALRAEFIPEDGSPSAAKDFWAGRSLEDTLSLP
jgi:hypothetical protein